jgi:hypothetical protein
MRLGRGVSMFYRFKRAHLANWREIADSMDTLIASFEKVSK